MFAPSGGGFYAFTLPLLSHGHGHGHGHPAPSARRLPVKLGMVRSTAKKRAHVTGSRAGMRGSKPLARLCRRPSAKVEYTCRGAGAKAKLRVCYYYLNSLRRVVVAMLTVRYNYRQLRHVAILHSHNGQVDYHNGRKMEATTNTMTTMRREWNIYGAN